MMKKAQAQIITTVLIILLVLAAIVIVWQVVSGTIEEGGEQVEEQSVCLGVSLDVLSADAEGDIVTVRRGGGSETVADIIALRYYVDGTLRNESLGESIGALESSSSNLSDQTVEYDLQPGEEVEVGFLIGNTWCPPISKEVAV